MEKQPRLLLAQIPFDCLEDELRQWIEARGFHVRQIDLIRDVISGTSPSFAHIHLQDAKELEAAADSLTGQALRGKTIQVQRVAPARAARA